MGGATTRHHDLRFGRCLLAAVATVVMVAGPAAAEPRPATQATPGALPGAIGIRLVDAPVSEAKDPRALVYIVDHLNPGAVIHRRVEVSNTTSVTTHVAVYAAAATITQGSFLGSSGHTANDLSTWTSVTPGESDIPSGGKLTAVVTIAVPVDAAPGEQYGVVWAEARSAAKPGGGVIQVSRAGIRLYLSVGPGGAPAADFTINSLTAKRTVDGRPVVVATVHNAGGRALDMAGTLKLLSGPGGLSAGPFPATLGTTLAIGDTEPVSIVLDKQLPAGPWDAQITLHSGLVERTAKATITFPVAGTSAPVKTKHRRSGSLLPAVAGAVALLVAVAFILFVFKRRRRRPDEPLPEPRRQPVGVS